MEDKGESFVAGTAEGMEEAPALAARMAETFRLACAQYGKGGLSANRDEALRLCRLASRQGSQWAGAQVRRLTEAAE